MGCCRSKVNKQGRSDEGGREVSLMMKNGLTVTNWHMKNAGSASG